VVSYINTSVEVKAESDILCTSRNAVDIVNSIPAEKPILFLPDVNLGNYVQRQTGRQNMKIWQGACIVHATFPARRLRRPKRNIRMQWWWRIRSVRAMCWRWRSLSGPPRR
jgi:Quinolinate synthase